MTNEVDYNKLFESGRLNPNIPEHKKLIDAYLAFRQVSNPREAQKLEAIYNSRLEAPKPEKVVEEPKEVKKPKKSTKTAKKIVYPSPKK